MIAPIFALLALAVVGQLASPLPAGVFFTQIGTNNSVCFTGDTYDSFDGDDWQICEKDGRKTICAIQDPTFVDIARINGTVGTLDTNFMTSQTKA